MRRNVAWLASLAFIALVSAATVARANIIVPGGSGTADQLTLGTTVTQASTSGTFKGAVTGVPKGSYTESVVTDSNNTFCAGCLDFIITETTTSGDVARITASDFTGYMTDVGVVSGSPGVAPSTVDRLIASNVGFNFNPAIVVGQSSQTLVIETNARAYKGGFLSFIDTGTATITGFAPAAEPGSAALLLMVLGVGVLLGKRTVTA